MKHFFIHVLFLFFFYQSTGQVTKGNWIVGGTGKLFTYKNEYSSSTYSNIAKYTQIDLSPNIGYFVADKLAFGIRSTFSSLKGEVTSVTDGGSGLSTNSQRFTIGSFGRYYLLSTDNRTNIVTEASYQVGQVRLLGGVYKGKLKAASFSAGPVIYFNSSVGIEFVLGYNYTLEDIENANRDEKKGFQIAIGFQIHLIK